MTDLGPIGMKQYLRQQHKRQESTERSMGGLLRPKPGVPLVNDAGGVSLDPLRTNDLARYGSRLVVWNFALVLATAPTPNMQLAKLPDTFWPDQSILINAWSGLGSNTGTAYLYMANDGWLYFQSATNSQLFIGGGAHFTAAL